MNQRIGMLKNALHCFLCGVFGLVPLLGVPAAIAAVVLYFHAPPAGSKDWRLIGPYLNWGLGLACTGLAITCFGLLLAATVILRRIASGQIEF